MRKIPDMLDMIRELVAIPSVSSSNPDLDLGNRPVVEHLAGWLETLGFATELLPLPGQPQKANLVASLGQGDGGLVLAGHTDTVPFDEGRWRSDPFSATVRDDRIYGLGTSDMKTFLAIAADVSAEFTARRPVRPLTLLATADEECSMSGARSLAESGHPRARYAVVGEPTGLRPVRMHKGIMMERLRVLGASGHSSDPTLGRNALEGMHRVLGALLELRKTLQRDNRNPAFHVDRPTLNLGHIHGGDNPNRICPECELHFDLRMLPGMQIETLRRQLRAAAAQALEGSGLELDYAPLFDGVPAMETPADSAVIRAAESLTGATAGAVDFGTEGPFFSRMGMETLILGPGDIEQAHQPDEYLALDRIEPMREILRQLVQRFCFEAEVD
ncbi:MAG TPA: acetylornithine deacetylase [Gammaproteobacteria bacterium]|nr:acetylornithine deacetylase [Gammaproteobacteria bacterium]